MGDVPDESFSGVGDLLDKEMRTCMQEVVDIIRGFPKLQGVSCNLCEGTVEVRNLHNFFETYGKLVYCLQNHTESIEIVDLEKFYLIEMFLLEQILPKQSSTIKEILNHHEGMIDLYDRELKKELINCFVNQYSIAPHKINCEQEVESLIYRYFRRLSEEERKGLVMKSFEFIMIVLFKRNEIVRFFRIYELSKKTQLIFRLALYLTILPECHVSGASLIKESENYVFETNGIAEQAYLDQMQDIWDIVLSRSDLETSQWLEHQKELVEWKDCIQVWANNRTAHSVSVDNSMIDLCTKKKLFDDGWLIYKSTSNNDPQSVHKAMTLCLKALKATQEKDWVEKIIQIIEFVTSTTTASSSKVVADDILEKVDEVPKVCREQILTELMEKLQKFECDESMVDSLLRGYLNICVKCQDQETCELCATHANELYNNWKKARNEKFLFFRKSGRYDSQIYCNMLGICEEVKDCKGFYEVCKDLLDNKATIDNETSKKIEKFHLKNCKGCAARRSQIITRKTGKNLLAHIFNKS